MSRILENPPAPGTPEWRGVISASKVPAILGISRFTSQFAMWHEMAGTVEPAGMDEDRADWGHCAEPALAEFWKLQNPGWLLNPAKRGVREIAYTDDSLPFPNVATIDRRAMTRKVSPGHPGRFHVVECKTAATMDDWGRPGDADSIPMDYYAQVQFQLGVSGIPAASLVVLGPFQNPEIHEVTFDADLFAGIVDRCEKWVQSLNEGTPPPLDDSPATYEAIRGVHPDIEAGEVVEIDPATATQLLDAVASEADGKRRARRAKIDATEMMGNAQYLKCGGVKIADRRSRAGGTPYVQFNKKAKELINE